MKCYAAIALSMLILGACASKPKTDSQATAPVEKKTEMAKKSEKSVEKKNQIQCKSGSDERTIEVATKQSRTISNSSDNVCEVVYTKFSNSEVVASSVSSLTHCETVANRIQTNLEGAGFTCK